MDPMGFVSSSIFTILRLSGFDSWRDLIALTQLPAWKTSEIKLQIAKTKCLLRLDHLKSQVIIYHATSNQKEISGFCRFWYICFHGGLSIAILVYRMCTILGCPALWDSHHIVNSPRSCNWLATNMHVFSTKLLAVSRYRNYFKD